MFIMDLRQMSEHATIFSHLSSYQDDGDPPLPFESL